ncbi:hypothetical protein Taro_025196 [Colocasia esculenta]|uniref:Uncharacterized protein n=1 Tax=Colocasia esculenta TaxID=4460 RepID=A0A843VBK2_COLES|nr:hypothetical protein [Colocasia esculenta]
MSRWKCGGLCRCDFQPEPRQAGWFSCCARAARRDLDRYEECLRGSNLFLGVESHPKIPAGAIDGVLHCTGKSDDDPTLTNENGLE